MTTSYAGLSSEAEAIAEEARAWAIANGEPIPKGPGPFVDWLDFWSRERSDPEWLYEQVLARGRGHSFYAAQKTGKSLALLWLAATLATGDDPVTVVYVDYEMGDDDLFERLTDMGYGPESDLSRLRYLMLPQLEPLDTQEGAAQLLELVDDTLEAWPDHHLAVVIDTYSRAVAGEENSSDTTRAFYRHTGLQLKRRGVTWARADHSGKDTSRGQRGSSAKGDDVDVIWKVTRSDDGLVLEKDAARMGWVPERVPLRRHDDPLRFSVAAAAWPEGTKALGERLDVLGVPRTASVKTARAALTAAGDTASQQKLAAAVRYRKTRA